MTDVRLLVTGSRFWTHLELLFDTLDSMHPSVVGHGACPRGADDMADEWAEDRGVPVLRWPADWERYGKPAGRFRNELMLAQFGPDRVVAFKDDFDFRMRSGGTEHMAAISLASGLQVSVVQSGAGITELHPPAQLPFS